MAAHIVNPVPQSVSLYQNTLYRYKGVNQKKSKENIKKRNYTKLTTKDNTVIYIVDATNNITVETFSHTRRKGSV